MNKFQTYREQIIIIAITGVHDLIIGLSIVLVLLRLGLLVLTLGESLVFALTKLPDNDGLLLFGYDELSIHDFLDEPVHILELAVIGVVDAKPVSFPLTVHM